MYKMSMTKEDKSRIIGGVAWIAAIFALIMSIMLIVNYLQLKSVDPLETPALQTLVDQLKNDPNNESLKEDIRALDLMIRKAYFTSQWQIRTGGLMLAFSVIVLILAVRYRKSLVDELEELDGIGKDPFLDKQKARQWVVYCGSGFFVLALVCGLLSKNVLKQYDANLSVPADGTANSEVVNAQYAQNQTGTSVAAATADAQSQSAVSTAESATNTNDASVSETPVNEATATTAPAAQATTPAAAAAQAAVSEALKKNVPYFRGHDAGVYNVKSAPTSFDVGSGQHVQWKAAVTLPGYNSPIVWGDKVFVSGATDNERSLYCFNATDGTLLWEAKATGIQGTPSGTTTATEDTGLAAPSVATNGDAVFAIFANGDIMAVNMDGNRLWARNLGRPSNYYGHSSSLIIYNTNLLVQYDTNRGSKIMALTIADGSTRWETTRNVEISWSSPIIVNTGSRDELILTAAPFVVSYNPETGDEYWSMETLSGEVGPSAAYSDGIVYSANEYASLSAIKLGATPEVIWQQDEYLPEASSPLAHNGLVIVTTSYGVLACYDAVTGNKYWEAEADDGIYGSPVFANGNVYIMTMQGTLIVFKLDKTYQQVARSELGEKSVCTPAFIEGKMFLRGYDNLYCIAN